jgi:hypothetical protein
MDGKDDDKKNRHAKPPRYLLLICCRFHKHDHAKKTLLEGYNDASTITALLIKKMHNIA